MNNSKNLAYEAKCNKRFLELEAEIEKKRAELKQLTDRRDGLYPFTSYYRWEQERKRMLGENFDESPLKPNK